jgi:hypothetical protein
MRMCADVFESARRLYRSGDVGVMAAVLAPLAVLYTATASPYVLGEDNGEFCTLFAGGGVAHPPGYPLYTLMLRALSWLPADTPARGAALVTAAIGLAAVALLYGACRAWGAGKGASALAAVVYGTAPLAWDLATKAEVFALNAALAAAIALVGASRGPARGATRAAWTGLLFGLGLSNHHSILLLSPLIVCSAMAALRESPHRGLAAALFAAGLVAGLFPYATLPFAAKAAGTSWVWGEVTTASGLAHHFLRRDFGTTQLAVGPAPPLPLAGITALARTLLVDLKWVPCLVGLAVLVVGPFRLGRAPDAPGRFAFVTLAASFVLAGPLFAARMNVPLSSPEGLAIVRRFHLLPLLLLTIPFALGLDAALRNTRPAFTAALAGTALAAGVVLGFGDVRDEHGPMIHDYVVDTLRTAPEQAVILGSGDVRVFGTLYAQTALGLRRDVVFVSPLLLHYDWYRRRVGDVLGMAIPGPQAGSIDTRALASLVLASGRRLFLADVLNGVITKSFSTYPLGTLIEVLPAGVPAPSPPELERRNLLLFEHYRLHPELSDRARAWSRGAREAYARPWSALARAYRAAGDAEGANRNERRAATLEPWIGRTP